MYRSNRIIILIALIRVRLATLHKSRCPYVGSTTSHNRAGPVLCLRLTLSGRENLLKISRDNRPHDAHARVTDS